MSCGTDHSQHPVSVKGGREIRPAKTYISKNIIEDKTDRIRDGKGDHHEKLGQPNGVGADSQGIAAANALGHNLAKNDNASCGAKDGGNATSQAIEQDGLRG